MSATRLVDRKAPLVTQILRLAAYGVCIQDGRMLLAHYVSPDGSQRHWTLPGGKVEHAEDPNDSVRREIEEETGYRVRIDRLLGVDSRAHRVDWGGPDGADLHRVGIFYRVRVVGGELRHEVGGSTDRAAWIPTDEVAALKRAVSIDVGLKLVDSMPADGHVSQVPVGGLVRY